MRRSLPILFVLSLLTSVGMAQQSLNLLDMKKDTQIFERIVDEKLRQVFTNPFAITDTPRAVYLQGYGVVVSFHLNVNRARIRTPFGEVDAPKRYGSAQKEEQIERAKQLIIECLEDYSGATIKQLNAHDRISISAHIEDRNELDPGLRRTIVVVSTSKDDADLLSMRRITSEEFKEKLLVVQY